MLKKNYISKISLYIINKCLYYKYHPISHGKV